MNKNSSFAKVATRRDLFYQFLIIFIPLIIIVSCIVLALYYSQLNAKRLVVETEEQIELNKKSDLLKSSLQAVVSDLMLLSHENELIDFIHNYYEEDLKNMGPQEVSFIRNFHLEDLKRELLTLSLQKSIYTKIRLIDRDGVEVVRLNYNDGVPEFATQDQLQEKSDRYYFKEAMKLGADEIYISPLDLRVEGGEVAYPLAPTIRFCTPLHNVKNEKMGVIILSYGASKLYDTLTDSINSLKSEFSLLNSDGFWLYSHDKEKEFGFMFDDKMHMRYDVERSEAWAHLKESDSSQFYYNSELTTFKRIYPFFDPKSTRGALKGTKRNKEYYWFIVSRLSSEKLAAFSRSVTREHLNLFYALIPLMLIISGFFARLKTSKMLAEEEMRESENELNLVFNSVDDAIFILDNKGRFVRVNDKTCHRLGYTREELFEQTIKDIDSPEFADRVPERLHNIIEKGQYVFESAHVTKSGRTIPVEVNSRAIQYKGQPAFLSVVRDITERKVAEEERQHNYLNLVGIIIVAVDLDQKITFINDAGCEALGYASEELIGKNWWQNFLAEESRLRAMESYKELTENAEGYVQQSENIIINKAKKERTIIWNNTLLRDGYGRAIGTLCAGEDITERKRAEIENRELWQQLLQSQKMESIGRISGGMAHDFNNILTAILGYSQIALEELEDHPAAKRVKIIKKSGERAAKLVSQLLAFSRKQVLEMELNNLNSIVEGMCKMLARVIGEDVTLDLNIDSPVHNIIADETQLEQIIMNLVVNARHAMEEGGKLTISTENVSVVEEDQKNCPGLQLGDYVKLNVEDTGVGMTDEVCQQIFEPFFTTKEKGAGTGLGLSTVFGIIKQHNGYIFVRSEVGKGTNFEIFFPKVEGEVLVEEEEGPIVMETGDETILIVDDDQMIRELAVDTLGALNYNLLVAENGKEALEICESVDYDFDLLLTDVVMPGINGWELYEKVIEKKSGIKTIFVSGYLENPIIIDKITKNKLAFINKPFKLEALAGKVRSILDENVEYKTQSKAD
ncbi:PAS domain S-box protein [Thermodesulfobacteriota bacterium]